MKSLDTNDVRVFSTSRLGPPPRTIRLLVAESHPVTRSGLARLAEGEHDMITVGETGSGEEALRIIEREGPDVVSLGVLLDDMSGLQLARDLRDRHANLGIVILTDQGHDDVMFRALENGVSAFVSKNAPVAEILGAIRHAAVAPNSFSASGLGQALYRKTHAPQRMTLSKREHEVLLLLHEGNSVPQIAKRLFVSMSTAKTYVARLYEKLGATNRSQALMTAVRQGLIDVTGQPVA
jgi:DNA-binding NarL/FixJ family response regulator